MAIGLNQARRPNHLRAEGPFFTQPVGNALGNRIAALSS
jgi:hypothetical protein